MKDRKDILVLTLNLDDNPGLIEGRIKLGKYTFPVLPAKDFAEQLFPALGLPQNWLIDGSGMLRMQQMGFMRSDKWVDDTIALIENFVTSRTNRVEPL